MMYGSLDIRCKEQSFLRTIFCPFDPPPPTPTPEKPGNQNFDKMKPTARDIIILYMCTINENHVMYVS